jgi:dihydrofolate reductase
VTLLLRGARTTLPLLRLVFTACARHVYVDGGVVIRSFLARRLLDQITISVVPVLIGKGIPLFGGVALESGLVVEQATSFENGIAQLRYRVQTSP